MDLSTVLFLAPVKDHDVLPLNVFNLPVEVLVLAFKYLRLREIVQLDSVLQ